MTARALVALMDGICLQVLLTGTPYDEAYAREVLGRLLPGDGGAGGHLRRVPDGTGGRLRTGT